MRTDTKLARIRKAMLLGDWDTALKVAARFQRLGDQDEAIRRGANAVTNPSFYRQIGQDVDGLKAEGITALKHRFAKSWSAVQTRKKVTEGNEEDCAMPLCKDNAISQLNSLGYDVVRLPRADIQPLDVLIERDGQFTRLARLPKLWIPKLPPRL